MASPAQPIRWVRCRGRDGWNPPQDVAVDMGTEALNIDLSTRGLGSKRGGATSTMTLTGFTGPFNAMFSWVPGQDETAREFFAIDSAATKQLGRVAAGSTMSAITLKDTIDGGAADASWAVLDGKLFIAYNSDENRLQVFDPGFSTSALRRAGLATPSAPTAADQGSGSLPATLRYYKIAYTYQSGGATLRRSQLSASVSFTPSGSGQYARVTKPSSISESETHWELYGSSDDATYYLISTIAVGTTTYDDDVTDADYSAGDAAPVAGLDTPFPSVKYLHSNGNRLFGFGVYETAAGSSMTPSAGTVFFGPALGETDVGDAERVNNTTTAVGRLILSRNAGGVDRGIAGLGNEIYAFQSKGIYVLIPTENADIPFRRVQVSNYLGAVSHQSIVAAVDEAGRPCLYFLDPELGPYRIGANGFQWCGRDVSDLWATVNLDATNKVAHGIYYPKKKQVLFWVATGSSNDPDTMLVLNTDEQRVDEYGAVTGGWAKYTGDWAACRCSTIMATTLGASMSRALSPYAGPSSGTTVLKGDTSDLDDAGTDFQAYVQSKAFDIEPLFVNKSVIRSYLLATVGASITIQQAFIRNFGDETNRTDTVDLTAAGSETRVLRKFEAAALEDAALFQVRLGDASAQDSGFTLDRWYAQIEPREER